MSVVVANAVKAAARNARAAAAGTQMMVGSEEAGRRLAICQGCPAFRAVDKRCGKCGCVLKWKTWLKAERCPDARW